jgi:hypothetical protein
MNCSGQPKHLAVTGKKGGCLNLSRRFSKLGQWDETQYGAITSLTHHPKVKWLDDFSLETGFDFQQQKCSGLYLWWPRPGKWKGALTIKSRSSSQRFIYDLHKVAGVYGLVMLLVLTFTGICLEIPEYANPIIGFFSTLEEPPKPQSQLPTATQSFISIDAAVGIAQHIYPEAELRWIETPHGPTG